MAVESLVSVKKNGAAAGRPTGKKHFVIIFRWADVKPLTIDTDGITVTKMEFQNTKKPVAVYATPETISCWDNLEGDTDAKGFIHHVAFSHPGDSIELAKFRNQIANEELGAITVNCGDDTAKLAGSPCAPLAVAKDDGKDDKEAVKHEFELASTVRQGPLKRIALSAIPKTDDAEIDDYLGLTAAAAASLGGV